MKVYHLTLIQLAKLGILKGQLKISTNKLASFLSMSQQNVSRHLIELEKENLLKRIIDSKGQTLILTKEGRKFFEEIYALLRKNFEEVSYMKVIGKVFTGLKEGAYYVTRKYYQKQFIEKLNFKPFPGTLNLKLIEPKDRAVIEVLPCIFIPGIRTKYRSYGWVKCFPAIIQGKYEGCLITLERTHYDSSVVEVISPYHLRKELGLKDGDIVEIDLIRS